MQLPPLRPYQQDALNAIEAQHAIVRSTLLVAATGTGKTRIFTEYARRFKRTLVLAHRKELLDQATATLESAGLTVQREQAQFYARRYENLWGELSDVVVASVQTLGRQYRIASDEPGCGWPQDAFDLIVVDEAHHSKASQYRRVLQHFKSAKVLGVTATPDRGDNRSLAGIFDSVAFRYEIQDGIKDGYLAPIVARTIVVDELELDGVKVTAGDFQHGDLAVAMKNEVVLQRICKPLIELSGDRCTIVFGPTVAWCYDLAERINNEIPGLALALDGKVDKDERAILLRESGHRILVNCQLFTEGFDDPSLSCVAICRPTKSRSAYTQMVGRGTRIFPGKEDLLLLDFTGVSKRHSLICPADVLAGRTDDPPTIKAARRIMEERTIGVNEALQEARRVVRKVKVKFWAQPVDPFKGDCGAVVEERASYTPAPSQGQLNCLRKFRVDDRVLNRLDRKGASKMIDVMIQRARSGLCTWKQAIWMRKLGYDPMLMTKDEASSILDQHFNRRR